MAELPDFHRNPECPKCGDQEIAVQYQTAETGPAAKPERMRRVCRRCGYTWEEKPLRPDMAPLSVVR